LDTFVLLESAKANFSISVPASVTTIEVDPDYHLFRKLYPDEVEPIVSAIMGNPEKRFISYTSEEKAIAAMSAFGLGVTGDTVEVLGPDDVQVGDDDHVSLLLNPSELPIYLKTRVIDDGESLVIDGTSYPRSGHTFVLTGQSDDMLSKYMVILTIDYESLPRIGQLVPHYGKYSYLVFKGPRNVGKGQWPVESSSLKKSL